MEEIVGAFGKEEEEEEMREMQMKNKKCEAATLEHNAAAEIIC